MSDEGNRLARQQAAAARKDHVGFNSAAAHR
jgi:hypothetical protein